MTEITVNHHQTILYKDGREFVHECDGSACRMTEEMEAAGFVYPVPYEEIEYAVAWKPRDDMDVASEWAWVQR